jgi:hypothetical protein
MRVLRGSARRQEGIPQGNPKLKHWATSPVFRRVERPKAKALGYLEAWRNRTLKLWGNWKQRLFTAKTIFRHRGRIERGWQLPDSKCVCTTR